MKSMLARVQKTLEYRTLELTHAKLDELAGVLVEFAEDVHNDIGIWDSLERYNIEFFGTPLPFVLQPNERLGQKPLNENRLQHLMWVLYSELYPELILSPTHRDLKQLSKAASDFLGERFARIPRDSGVKMFLAQPNKFGWDVKTKLLWLGMHSYLFRNGFRNYVQEHGGKAAIPVIDDFVCQKATSWSGLGVIDILAAVLDISEAQRSALRSWYERHCAYYRILTNKGTCWK